MGRECCWTPSWFSRAKREGLGYPTCCRQVYLNILCKAAKQVNLSDTRPDAHLCGPRVLRKEKLACSHYYFPFMPVYKFLEDFFLE